MSLPTIKSQSIFAAFLMCASLSFAQTEAPTETTATVAPAASTAQPTATPNTVVAKTDDIESRTKGSFSVSMYTLGGFDDAQLRNYTDSSYAIYDSYVSFNYRLNKSFRVAARPAFAYTTAGKDYRGNEVTDKITNRDFSMLVTQYNIFEDYLPATMDLRQEARLYLPTSESSKAEGLIARLRYDISGKYFLGRYSGIRAWFKPSYYFQRTTAFVDDFGNTRLTRNMDSTHGLELDWNLNKYFSLKPGFEIEDKWSFSSEVNTCGTSRRPIECEVRRASEISYRFGVEIRPIKAFNFTVGIQEKRDLIDPAVQGVVSYSVLTNLSIY